jgi:hypothetical protein
MTTALLTLAIVTFPFRMPAEDQALLRPQPHFHPYPVALIDKVPPPPEPTQSSSGSSSVAIHYSGSGDMVSIICSVFGSTCSAAVSTASCESGLDPNAVNTSSGAAGLFQFMPFHWEGQWNPFDPLVNSQHAYSLSNGGTNWSAWSYPCGTG